MQKYTDVIYRNVHGPTYRIKYEMHVFLPTWTPTHRNLHIYAHPYAGRTYLSKHAPRVCITRHVWMCEAICTRMYIQIECTHVPCTRAQQLCMSPCPLFFFGPEFWNSSTCFCPKPRIFLDLIFSRSIVPAETLISCLDYPSGMSHHDTLHFRKTLDTLWRCAGGPGVSTGGPEGPGPGKLWTSPASSEMEQCFIYLQAKSHLLSGSPSPGQKSSLPLCPYPAHYLNLCFKGQCLCPGLESSGDWAPVGQKTSLNCFVLPWLGSDPQYLQVFNSKSKLKCLLFWCNDAWDWIGEEMSIRPEPGRLANQPLPGDGKFHGLKHTMDSRCAMIPYLTGEGEATLSLTSKCVSLIAWRFCLMLIERALLDLFRHIFSSRTSLAHA